MVRKHPIKEKILSNFVHLLLVLLYEDKLFTELTSNYFFLNARKYSIHCYSAQGGSEYNNGINHKNGGKGERVSGTSGKEGPNKGGYKEADQEEKTQVSMMPLDVGAVQVMYVMVPPLIQE